MLKFYPPAICAALVALAVTQTISLATVTNQAVKTVTAYGTGAIVSYTIGFDFRDNGQIAVTEQDNATSPPTQSVLVYGSGAGKFTVTGGNPGAYVLMGTAPSVTQFLIIRRVTPIRQDVHYSETEAFPAEDTEAQMDGSIFMLQELNSHVDQKIGMAATSTATVPTMPDPVANSFLQYNSAGTDLTLSPASPASGDVLKFDGSAWSKYALGSKLSALDAVDATKASSADLAAHAASTGTHGVGVIAGVNDAQVLTNKTIDASSNTVQNIANSNVKVGAAIDWAKVSKTASNLADLATKSHTDLSGIGTNTHAQIDTALTASASHIATTAGNPHNVTASDVGSGTAQWNANRINGKTVDNTAIGNGKTLTYNSGTGNIEYASGSAALSAAHIFVGDGSGIAQDRAMTGVVAIDTAGLTTLGPSTVSNSNVSSTAGIAWSKVAVPSVISADTFTGALNGNASSCTLATSATTAISATSFSGSLIGDVTGTQGATVIGASTVTGKAITGFASAAGTVGAGDSILQAINKLDGNVGGKQQAGNYITALTGDVTASGPGSVSAGVAFVGGSSASNVHSAELAANGAVATATPGKLVLRDTFGGGNFSAGTITAALIGNASTATSTPYATTAGTALDVGGSSAVNVHAAELLANAATSSATANAMMLRDSFGNVSASTVNAYLNGTALNAAGVTNGVITNLSVNATAGIAITKIGSGAAAAGTVATADGSGGVSFAAAGSSSDQSYELSNVALAAATGSHILTVSLKGKDGSDPSGANVVKIGVRSATASNGTYSQVSVTAGMSFALAANDSIGQVTSSGTPFNVYYISDATSELCGSYTYFPDNTLQSASAVTAGADTDNTVLWCTSAHTSRPIRLLGRVGATWVSGTGWTGFSTVAVVPVDHYPIWLSTGGAICTTGTCALAGKSVNVNYMEFSSTGCYNIYFTGLTKPPLCLFHGSSNRSWGWNAYPTKSVLTECAITSAGAAVNAAMDMMCLEPL